MTLTILSAGPLSLLQDNGRQGYQHLGVSCGGPMDKHAFAWANHLLGNRRNAAQIEITLGPFYCQFEQDTVFALTGADMMAKLNDLPLASWQSHSVQAGDCLKLAVARSGLRAYLAVRGGFQANALLGSCATVVRDHLGGLDGSGKALEAGDKIKYAKSAASTHKQVPGAFIPEYKRTIKLAMMSGYQYGRFSAEAKALFFSSVYTVSSQMDRMGYRLSGPPIEYPGQALYSEGIALGAVQIPGDGQPIVLMRDRPTIGGYPKIGCVSGDALNRLAQCLPGSTVQFYKTSLECAREEWLSRHHFFKQ